MYRSLLPLRALALGVGLLVVTWEGGVVRADPPASPVVVRIGKRTITAAELEARLGRVPSFQLRAFGNTPEEIKRGFLERVMVREVLFAEGALAKGVAEVDQVKQRIRGIESRTLASKLAEEANRTPVSDAEVRAYYDKNIDKFHTPPKVELWQIVASSREDATQVLEELQKEKTPRRFADLARERSLDKVTYMRGGRLGFVAPDGSTSEAGFRVGKAVLDAAAKVPEGELVTEPVQDGEHWVIVWKRGTMPPVERSLDSEASAIRQILARARAEADLKETVRQLRKAYVTEEAPELVEAIEVGPTGEVAPMRRPGTAPHAASARPAPTQGPRGLR